MRRPPPSIARHLEPICGVSAVFVRRLLPPRCLPLAFWPATLPWPRVAVLVLMSFGKGADGFCCAGAEADDGGLVAEGALRSV